jgi:hypothetical protein
LVTARPGRRRPARGPAEVEHPLGGLGGVGDREVLAIASTAVKPPAAAARPGGDRLGVLAAGFAQVGVQVDQARQQDQPVGVDRSPVARLGWASARPISAITPSRTRMSAARLPQDFAHR